MGINGVQNPQMGKINGSLTAINGDLVLDNAIRAQFMGNYMFACRPSDACRLQKIKIHLHTSITFRIFTP